MTIDEAINKVNRILHEAPDVAVEYMKAAVAPHNRSEELYKSIHKEQMGADEYFVGTDLYYAKYVARGRGPVVADKKVLHWVDGGDVFAMYSSPYEGDNFALKAAQQLRGWIASL